MIVRRLLHTSALGLILVGCASVNRAQSVEFEVDLGEIDLGEIDPIGDLKWSHTLGTSWNDNFSIGGIVGKKNATITPEVDLGVLGTIPAITADTRTGARMSGRVTGGTGLVFSADFDPSRLFEGSNFQFVPSVKTPSGETAVTAGEFFALATSPGMVEDESFGEEEVHLPSFEADMSLFFNLDLKSKIEGGLFPIIPYLSTDFNPPEIDIDVPLVNFGFDLDRKSNPDSEAGIPPTLTLFPGNNFVKQEIKFLDDQASVFSQQISVDMDTGRLDVGEVQLVNPFGVETDAGGTKTNLTVSTSMGERSIDYSFETPLLRLGLDVDGIAGFLATAAATGVGQSFTRLEEDIKFNNEKIAEITADLIDIKYGPEIGYRESVEINPDFDVTLTFDRDVAVKTDDGISVTKSTPGNWNDLPEISLLDDQQVQVTVTFNKLTGEQTKRGSFYLTDYLELTLLEIEDVTILDTVSLSLPPLVQERTSLLGRLLGQIELDVFNDSQAIDDPNDLDDDITIMQSETFTFPLQAEPSSRLYRFADSNPDDPLAGWLSFADHEAPNSLGDKVLVIGRRDGDGDPTHVGQLTPMDFEDEPNETVSLGQLFQQQWGLHPEGILSPSRSTLYPDPGEPIDVEGLEIIAGSRYLHTSGGIRRWNLPSIRNDGRVHATQPIEITAKDQLLQLTGSGSMVFEGPTAIQAATLFNGEGHTLTFLDAVGLNISPESVTVRYSPSPLIVLEIPVTVHSVTTDDRPLEIRDNIQNAGTIRFVGTNATVALDSEFANAATGTLGIHLGSAVHLITPRIVQDGLVAVDGLNSVLQITGNPVITTEGTTGTFEAAGGGLLQFLASPQNPTKIGEVETLNFNDLPPEKSLTFRAASGGEVSFFPAIEQRFDVRSRFETEPGGTMRLNGLSFPDIDVPNTDKHPEYTEAASQFIEVINRGTLIVQSGRNNLFLKPSDAMCTPNCGSTDPEPFVVPINLVNEGTVQIEAGAEFGFQVEIQDYAEGGAKLVGGTWKLMGATNVRGSNLVVPPASHEPLDPDLAVLNIEVVKVSDDDNILGSPFNIGDFDTELAINAANVTLSGRAVFPYFNTLRENEGVINLENYVFNTEGDLVNRGEIHLENNAVLALHGALTIDEGSVTFESGSTLLPFPNDEFEFGPISVIGGSFTWPNPTGAASFEEAISSLRWVVREKWGEDTEGNEVIVPSRVDFAGARIRTIETIGDFLLDGAEASMDSLASLERNRGKLTLTGGNELRLSQNLNNEGSLTLAKAGKLYVDGQLTTSGQLVVGPDTYLDVTDSINATTGSVTLDGLVHAPDLTTSATTVLGGSGELTGSLNVGGDFLATIAEPGMDANELVVHGQTMLGGNLLLQLGGYIPQSDDVLSILNAMGGLSGAFSNVASGERLETADGIGSFLVNYMMGSGRNRVLLTAFEPSGDYNGDGTFDAADYVVWRKTDGSQDGYDTWRANFGRSTNAGATGSASASVPEPSSATLCCLFSLLLLIRRRLAAN